MKDTAGFTSNQQMKRVLLSLFVVAGFTQDIRAQVYTPVFKSVEMQATVSPLGEMVAGNFFGRRSIAAISKSEKAVYFFEPDSFENLILTNVVSLPDTPVAISKGREVIIDSTGHRERLAKLAVLMKPDYVALISFDPDGQPKISPRSTVDSYCTGVRAVDMETSGKLDLIGYGKFSLGVSVEKNEGNDQFKSVQSLPGPLSNVPFNDIAFTDFNGDLVPDMAALDWVNRRLLIFYGRGDGTFAQPVTFQLKAEPSTLAVADLSGNGYPDIVVGYARLSEIDVFAGDGFGRFFLRQSIKCAAPVSKFAIADYTGDGTMDIAALSRSTGEIMLFSYDPLSRSFQYSGVVGTGETYDDIVPFYFQNRIRADLVASSPVKNFLKIFKSAPADIKLADKLIPVGSKTEFVSVCGVDSSNYVITGDTAGNITARYSSDPTPFGAHLFVDWRSDGTPSSIRLLSEKLPSLLVSYSDANMLSLVQIQEKGSGVTKSDAETAFPPFATAGDAQEDTASIVAAYRLNPDSTVDVSYFTALKGKSEFLEHDYTVNDTEQYVSSAVTLSPTLSFLRIWRLSGDSLEVACTNLWTRATSRVLLKAYNARLLTLTGGGFPLVVSLGKDTLTLYSVSSDPGNRLSLVSLCSTPFDSDDFATIRVTPRDSSYYMSYVNRADKSVFLYELADSRLRFVKAWHLNEEPTNIALSPSMKTIYFLNRSEAYVSIHTF